jgi:hypothetical protein
MRQEVVELGRLGPLPPFQSILNNPEGEVLVRKYGDLITSIQRPVTDDEARVLVGILGPGDCFELEWSLIHLIETAPGWPMEDCLADTGNQWVSFLKQRVENSRRTGKISNR